MTTSEYPEILHRLALQLTAIAALAPEHAARELGPLLARNGDAGIEGIVWSARRAAAQQVVNRAGTQRAAAELIGMAQGNLSRLLSGKPSPATWAKMAKLEPKRKQRKAVGSA